MEISDVSEGGGFRAPDIDLMSERAKQAADMLKALSHERRLMIFCYLVEGEKSVSELEDLTGSRQAAVSQQLARLRYEGMVGSRRDGKAIYYSIADEKVRSLLVTLHRLFCEDN